MCLLFCCLNARDEFPLILLANRDEFYDRPASRAGFWPEARTILAGRDLQRGGTWLGIDRSGRWAALTNYREPSDRTFDRSRGYIVRDYLAGTQSPSEFAESINPSAAEYDGFNLLFGDPRESLWLSNRSTGTRTLEAGIYGLSNHLLETPWPKVSAGKRRLQELLNGEMVKDQLFEPLTDRTVYDRDLPDTGLSAEIEHMLSSAFIAGDRYGTRCSTLIMIDKENRVFFEERSYDARTNGPVDPNEYCSQILRFRLDC